MTLQELLDALDALSNPVSFETINNELLAPINQIPSVDIPTDLLFGIASEIPSGEFSDGETLGVAFSAAADQSWALIEGLFTISALTVSLQWTVAGASNEDQQVSLTTGTLTGSFEFAGETIILTYDFTAPASEALTGTFPSINLQQIVSEYLTSVTLPAEFPTIDFSNLPISIDPDNRSFTFNGASTSPWTLMGDTLSLDQVTLNVTGALEGDEALSVNGAISGRLQFTGADAILSFAFGEAYELTTTVETLDLGDIITTLVSNVSNIDIPDGLPESLTINDVIITIDEENDAYSVRGQSEEEWVVLENLFAISNPALDFTVTLDEENEAQIEGGLNGQLTVAEVDFNLGFDFTSDTFNVSGNLADGQEISFFKLASDIFADDPINFPEAHDVTFRDLTLDIAPTDVSNGTYTFAGTADLAWVLIPGVIELDNIALALTVATDGDPTVTGILAGNLDIGGKAAAVGYGFDPEGQEFKLFAELPDLSFTEIINGLLEPQGISIPTSIHDFSFSDIEIEVRPESGIYTLRNNRDEEGFTWEILPGLFSLTQVGIEFIAELVEDSVEFQGGIKGMLNLGPDVAIMMAFEFSSSDFKVDGSIETMKLGSLAEGLLASAGLAVDLPDVDIAGPDPNSPIGISILPNELDFSLVGSLDGEALSFYGINIDIPAVSFTISIHKEPQPGGAEDAWVLAFSLDISNTQALAVSTNFAWVRDLLGEQLRELHNDPDQTGDAPLISLSLTANKDVEITILKTALGNAASTTFLEGFASEDWTPDFNFNTSDFTFPFLNQSGGDGAAPATAARADSPDALALTANPAPAAPANESTNTENDDTPLAQAISVKWPELSDVDFVNGEIAIPVDMFITLGTVVLESGIALFFNISKMAFRVEHSGGIEILSDQEELTTEDGSPHEIFGLEWRFFGEKKEDRYHHFTLVTKDFNYQLQQAPGARIEVAYTKASKDPIKFQITDFALTSKGLTVTADVLDDPARLNGVDTKFRFGGSQLKIVENRIQDFTLSGSGPLPPDLVGDAMVDISMQFQQRDGALTLVAGAAKLRGNKILDAKATRFQFSIDAIGLKFVNDGQIHLFFTLTGTARFVLASGDDKNGALALLPTIQIDLHECPLTGDASVIAQHVSFLIELPKPVSFPIFGAYQFELRAIGFLPNFEVFDAAAMQLTGQVKFAQGPGDTANNEPDYHALYIALPEPGSFLPRLYMDRLPLSIQMGEAFKLDGVLEFLNSDLEKGFAGEGVLEIKGLPPIAASFAFLRVRKRETDPFVRAWFIFIELRQVSFRVPVLEFYIREIGLGFGYRYTLVAIKAADEANDLGELISELKVLSRTAGDLSKRDRWAVDIEEPGQDLRWTIVFRAMISQLSAAPSPLTWNQQREEKLANAFLFDAVIAFRSDLTFFMNVRGWINTSYGEFVKQRNNDNQLEPLFSGFVFLWPRQKRFLAHLASNPNGHLGSNPKLPSFVEDAVRNGQFSATLLIEPSLMHFELGWPNMLRWANKIGPLNAEMRGGFIFRISDKEMVLGISYTARANLRVEAGIDLGLVGASLLATADAALGARFIGVIEFADGKPTVYGAIGMELNIRVDINLWIKIPLLFKTIKLSYNLTFRLNFTAGLELGFDGLNSAGLRGSGSVSVSAMGHRLHFSAKFSTNGSAVTAAKQTTDRFLNIGLEATEVEPVPGIESEVTSSAAISGDATTAATVSAAAARNTLTFGTASATAFEANTGIFETPDYRIFVIRDNQRNDDFVYFTLLPRGEGDVLEEADSKPGFLPVPPDDELDLAQEAYADFTLQFSASPDIQIDQFDPFAGDWQPAFDTAEPIATYSWKANWHANIFEDIEEFSAKEGEETTPVEADDADFAEGMTLRAYLRTAYITNAFAQPTGDAEETTGEATAWLPVSDPMSYVDQGTIEDQRVHNPSDNAFEAAVRGAQEQFQGSPFFKRDQNLKYDQALEVAFQEDRTIYTATGYTPRVSYDGVLQNDEATLQTKLIRSDSALVWMDEAFTDEEYNALKRVASSDVAEAAKVGELIKLIEDMAKQKQAIQVRSLVINDLIQDASAFADAPDDNRPDITATSIPFNMGLVFRVKKEDMPGWLTDDQAADAPTLFQRNTTSATTPDLAAPRSVTTFNIDLTDFGTNPPQFQRVRHYTDASTVAITWDLIQSFPEDSTLTAAQRNPDHNLLHYEVRRLPLDGRDREVVYQVKAAAALCPADEDPGSGSTENIGIGLDLLKPRFQVVDHFTEESAEDLAALPSEGRSYLYTITPVDYAGKSGHPLTLVATRFPNEPPRVPVNGELVVTYELDDADVAVQQVSNEAASTPEIVTPTSVEVTWTEPADQRDGPRVAIKDHFLIFRKETTLPIGSYGLDSATSRPRSKQLPTSNARALRSDIKIQLQLAKDEDGNIIEGRVKRATVSIEALQNQGVLPVTPAEAPQWRPESWRVYFQTVSTKDVPSALSPVQLVFRVQAEVDDAFEERRPAELEWLPKPIRMAMLPPEDQRAITGLAHFPMPQGSFVFGSENPVSYNLHPAALRAIRFRWNQGPSNQQDYPLDLTAGYDLLQLDIDAHTTDTFNEASRLAEALQQIQEIQMISADDLLLTPGDTLSTQTWEAWYPSTIRRLLTPEERIEGSESMFAPWYSWRESILEWPAWPGLTDAAGSVRDEQLHPFLRTIEGAFKGEAVVEFEWEDPVLNASAILDTLRNTMASGGTLADDAAFRFAEVEAGIEFRFRHQDDILSFTARLEAGKVSIYMSYRATLQTSPPLQPGDLNALINNTPAGPDPYGWGILQRFGLSATLSLQNEAGDIVTGEELINAIQFVLFLQPELDTTPPDNSESTEAGYRRFVCIEQLYQRNKSVSLEDGTTEPDALLGIIQISLRPVVVPKREYKRITIRRKAGLDESISDLRAHLVFTHQEPFSMIDQANAAAGQTTVEPEFAEDGTTPIPVKQTFQLPLSGTTNILIRCRRSAGDDAFAVGLSQDEADIADNANIEIEQNSFFATDDLATYFTVPLDALTDEISSAGFTEEQEQWLRLKRYAESLNSTDPDVPDDQKINFPASGDAFSTQLPEILAWLQRFMDVSGDITDTPALSGPWLATAYPKSGTPAHATPDESGRITYNHLIRDGWAHNYRYYIRPNDRYGLLWDSLLQSTDLYPATDTRERQEASPKTDAGGLDVVIERINPVDKPVILRSARLDPPMRPGTPAKPGKTWEVIVGQHREQALMEKNQTLARQLAYRQIAFTLLRRQTFNTWVTQLNVLSGDDTENIELIRVENQYPDIPKSYPESPVHLDLTADVIDESALLSIELPERIGTFQQGAMVLQWDALPFYYAHRLMLIAQTTTTVSKINQTEQRDFEYVSPNPDANITYLGDGAHDDTVDEVFTITIELKRFWDSLPETAQAQWPSESPEVTSGAPHQRTLSSLPDPEVVYQIIEIFNGNIEVQFEVYFDNETERFEVQQLGKRIVGRIDTLISPNNLSDAFYYLTLRAFADPDEQSREAVLNPENVRIVARRGGAAPSPLTELEELTTS
ncbi:MAG: hypothetical protein AAF564_19545 [Bacteroidota bacterium]